jgi:hypothetical protein
MSERMASSTSEIEIYVPLLNEGTEVLRPTTGIVLQPGVARLVVARDYRPEVEQWEFLPGTTVKYVKETRGGRELFVARQRSLE